MPGSIRLGLPVERPPPVENIPVAFTANVIGNMIVRHISVPLSPEQLETAEITAKFVEPVIYDLEKSFFDEAVLYNIFACYYFFMQSSKTGRPSHRRLMETRCTVCLRVAQHIVHDFENDALARALVYDFYPLNQGSPRSVPRYLRVSALELAVKAEARLFLMEPPVFATVNDIWNGSISVERHIDSSQPPRLRYAITDIRHRKSASSPMVRHIGGLISASIFLLLYLLLIQEDPRSINPVVEGLFSLWSCGYALEEYNQLSEFGSRIYFISLWNLLDTILVAHVFLYWIARALAVLLPSQFPKANMAARGVLITAGLFIVPRLFSVFDNNRVFSNMIFSLKRVSSDFLLSWFIVMIFSVGVWVSVAFSVPRVRLTSADYNRDNGGKRTALAMFKMVFSDAGELWENWFNYTVFDRIALCFYLILAQFIMPTVVTAVLANSFANIRERSEEEFYFMRAAQALLKIKSPQLTRASTEDVSPLNFIAWIFEWSEYVLPSSVYDFIAVPVRYICGIPGQATAYLSSQYMNQRSKRKRNLAKHSQETLEQEIDRSLGEADAAATSQGQNRVNKSERLGAKFGLVKEVFTNKKVARALAQHPEWNTKINDESSEIGIKDRLASIESALERLEAKLTALTK